MPTGQGENYSGRFAAEEYKVGWKETLTLWFSSGKDGRRHSVIFPGTFDLLLDMLLRNKLV